LRLSPFPPFFHPTQPPPFLFSPLFSLVTKGFGLLFLFVSLGGSSSCTCQHVTCPPFHFQGAGNLWEGCSCAFRVRVLPPFLLFSAFRRLKVIRPSLSSFQVRNPVRGFKNPQNLTTTTTHQYTVFPHHKNKSTPKQITNNKHLQKKKQPQNKQPQKDFLLHNNKKNKKTIPNNKRKQI